jgi:hypothetical protein
MQGRSQLFCWEFALKATVEPASAGTVLYVALFPQHMLHIGLHEALGERQARHRAPVRDELQCDGPRRCYPERET